MVAKLRRCPKGTRRNAKSRRCQPTKRRQKPRRVTKRKVLKRKPVKRKVAKRKLVKRRVVRVHHLTPADPYHPYVPRGSHNPDRHWGIHYSNGSIRLRRPTGCGGRYRHQCDNSASCQWNEYRNHCEARPEVFAGQQFEGPENRT